MMRNISFHIELVSVTYALPYSTMSLIMINRKGCIIFYMWNMNLKRDSNHLLIELQRIVCDLKLPSLNCARWTGLALEIIACYH